MQQAEELHPELVALESWFTDMHLSVFETMVNAQAVTNEASSNGGEVINEHESFRALQIAFLEASKNDEFGSHVLTPLVKRTLRIERGRTVPQLHLAQTWAAGTCTLLFFKMLDAIPPHLLREDSVSGELRHKSRVHMAQWQALLDDVH
ncbi:hypothetical protein [Alteromonas sp. H39]|uniref:hypothetical protein n=1 Tax=Alteromonas sp. H39 TaxID=3389876 RepID=UPI0039DF2D27